MKQSPFILTVTEVVKVYAMLTMQQRRQITLTLSTLLQANANETPAPITQEAHPATVVDTSPTIEAVTRKGAGLGPRSHFVFAPSTN